jgi:hydrogenase maturation protease
MDSIIMVENSSEHVKTLIVGVGNPILSDDGVGIHLARMLEDLAIPNLQVAELPASGLELLDMVLDHDRVVIIDAIETAGGTPGDHYIMAEEDFRTTVHGSSPHGINIATALEIGRKIVPERMPKEIIFIAIEAKDLINVSESLTPEVADKLPSIIRMIREDILRG